MWYTVDRLDWITGNLKPPSCDRDHKNGVSLFMSVVNGYHRKTKFILLSGVIVLLLCLSFFLYLNYSPEFPASIPSSEDIGNHTEVYRKRQDLFRRYTRYVRENHGGLLVAEEKRRLQSDAEESTNYIMKFLHKYKYFDETLAFNLTKYFAKRENLGYRIKALKPDTVLPLSGQFKIEFFDEEKIWIEILIQTTGSIIKQYEEPIIKAAVDLEPSESDTKSSQKEPTLPANTTGKLAIIIDDLGHSTGVLRKLVELNYALTFSILPNLENTSQTAEIIHDKNYEMLLHLPMQPIGWPAINPGPGALMITDDDKSLARKLEINLLSVRYAVGANNHMGSAFTKHGDGLQTVMEVLKSKNLFFIDSKTAPGNTARNTADLYGVPYLSRNIFLDNHQDEKKIEIQLYKAAKIAEKHGQAIAIGHPYLSTLRVLAANLPILEKRGIRIVPVSNLIKS